MLENDQIYITNTMGNFGFKGINISRIDRTTQLDFLVERQATKTTTIEQEM